MPTRSILAAASIFSGCLRSSKLLYPFLLFISPLFSFHSPALTSYQCRLRRPRSWPFPNSSPAATAAIKKTPSPSLLGYPKLPLPSAGSLQRNCHKMHDQRQMQTVLHLQSCLPILFKRRPAASKARPARLRRLPLSNRLPLLTPAIPKHLQKEIWHAISSRRKTYSRRQRP